MSHIPATYSTSCLPKVVYSIPKNEGLVNRAFVNCAFVNCAFVGHAVAHFAGLRILHVSPQVVQFSRIPSQWTGVVTFHAVDMAMY
jgi:hypothetical protein